MRKTTAALAASTLGVSAAIALTAALPGIASANSCGNTAITSQTQFDQAFNGPDNDTRSAGHNVMTPDGLHVYTDDSTSNAKAAKYMTADGRLLSSQTADSNYGLTETNNSGGKPGYNLVVDLNGADAGGYDQLVWEPDVYGDVWWSTHPLVGTTNASGEGSPYNGTLQNISENYPQATISEFGYSLGSGVQGDNTLTQIKFGCNTFSFGFTNHAPTASFTATAEDSGKTIDFDASASSAGGDNPDHISKYVWDFGDGQTNASVDNGTTPAGSTDKHTYAKSGTYTVTLTVTDAYGASDTATKNVPVAIKATATGPGGQLPNTGADVLGLAAAGAIVLVAGGAGLVVSRRRKVQA